MFHHDQRYWLDIKESKAVFNFDKINMSNSLFLQDLSIVSDIGPLPKNMCYTNGIQYSLVNEVRIYNNNILIQKTNSSESFLWNYLNGQTSTKTLPKARFLAAHRKSRNWLRIILNSKVYSQNLKSLKIEVDFNKPGNFIQQETSQGCRNNVNMQFKAFISFDSFEVKYANPNVHQQLSNRTIAVIFQVKNIHYLKLDVKGIHKIHILIDKPWTADIPERKIEFDPTSNTITPTQFCTINLLDRTELNLVLKNFFNLTIIYENADGFILDSKKISWSKMVGDVNILFQ